MARWERAKRVAWVVRVLVPLALVALAVRFAGQLDLAAIGRAIRHAEPLAVTLAAALNLPLVWAKATRARLLLAPTLPFGTRRLMGWFLASYAADNLVMSQAGLALRIGLIQREGVPLAIAVSEQALEKLLEGAGLLALASLAPLSGALPSWLTRSRASLAWVGAAFIVVALAVVASTRPWGWLGRVARAAVALRKPAGAAAVLLLTALAWALELWMVAAVLGALALPVTLATSLLVVVACNLAALVPGLPANMGTFEAAAVVALVAQGVAAGPALGFALLYHALHTVPVTLLGLPSLRRSWKAE